MREILVIRFIGESFHERPRAIGDVQKGALSPVLSLSKGRPQVLWRTERTGQYVSTTKGRERR